MTGKQWLVAAGLGILLTAGGCGTCGHHVCKIAREAGPNCAVPLCDRQHVYVFMINGLTPYGSSGLEGLRDKLAESGFTKVYCGQLSHTVWFGTEMRRLHAEEPEARFVLVGHDVGGTAAARLAADAVEDGLPVDALVMLDPMGSKPPAVGCSVRTLLICSGTANSPLPHTERIAVPDAGHFTLPAHPQTVAAVCGVLGEVARKVEHPEVLDINPLPTYPHAPPVRAMTSPASDREWGFLLDQVGTHNVPLTPVDAAVKLPASPPPARGR